MNTAENFRSAIAGSEIRRPAGAEPASSKVGGPQSVEFHIDELVLHGFSTSDGYQIGEAIERELTSLITSGGGALLSTDTELAIIDGGAMRTASGAKPEAIGSQVAHAIYRGLAGKRS